MTSSRLVPALNALYAMAASLAPSMASVPGGSVQVLYGPQPTSDDMKDMLLIGVDDPMNSAGPALAIDGEQKWANIGGQSREENFTIYSTYVAWTGDNDIPGCLARADANLGILENALRVNPSGMNLNGALEGFNKSGWCGMALSRVGLLQAGTWTAAHVQFVVQCTARI